MVGKKKGGGKNIETLGDSRGCILLVCHKHGLCQRSWETLNVTLCRTLELRACMQYYVSIYMYIYVYICVRTLSLKNIWIFIFDITLNENYV